MLISLIILFLLLSALFSGTEIAFVSGSKLRIELIKNKGSNRGRILAGFYEKPADFLGSLLVGNNIALVVFTYLMTRLLTPFIEPFIGGELLQLFVNTVLITIVVLIFGEFLPKTLFRLYADEALYFLAYPLRMLRFLLSVPAWVMIKLSNFFLRLFFKDQVNKDDDVFTRVDLEQFVRSASRETEEDIDTELFEKALHLKDIRVRECMIPRPEIESFDVDGSVEELLELFQSTKLSRLLVYEDDIDNVLGYVHHQQLLAKPKNIKKLILELPIVPEVMRARELMNIFIKSRLKIACVVDEFGGTAGIITLEDILEEIFGEIEDEHDQEEYVEDQISETEYLFSGRLEIDYLNEKYETLNLPEGEYHTLSGYIVHTTQNIPKQGAMVEHDGLRFILELVSDTKIETIRVINLTQKEEKEKPDS